MFLLTIVNGIIGFALLCFVFDSSELVILVDLNIRVLGLDFLLKSPLLIGVVQVYSL